MHHATPQAKHQVECIFLPDIVVRERASLLELLATEDEALLVGRHTLSVLELLLHHLDRVRGFDNKGDGLPSERFDEELPAPPSARDGFFHVNARALRRRRGCWFFFFLLLLLFHHGRRARRNRKLELARGRVREVGQARGRLALLVQQVEDGLLEERAAVERERSRTGRFISGGDRRPGREAREGEGRAVGVLAQGLHERAQRLRLRLVQLCCERNINTLNLERRHGR